VPGISRLIWRRFSIRSDMSRATLQATLPILFGCSDGHLQYGRIHSKEYGGARVGGPDFDDDPCQVPIAALPLHRGERCPSVYNGIAYWVCDLRRAAIVPLESRRFYPVCTGGKRAAPPEECGGAWADLPRVDQPHVPLDAMGTGATALERLLKADDQTTIRQVIGDPETFREAVDQLDLYLQFRPEHFDRRAVKARLPGLVQPEGTWPCSTPCRS
jgi:hypothetical protein